MDWEYSGSDDPFKSVLMKNGSPPQNALPSKPDVGLFVSSEYPWGIPVPDTGIEISQIMIGLGAVLSVAGVLVLKYGEQWGIFGSSSKNGKRKTVVVYE